MEVEKDIILKNYKRHFKAFTKHLKANQKKITVEGIHQLRVQVKRLRAILEVIELTSLDTFRKRKHFVSFRPLFKCAGELREIQINLFLLKKLPKKKVRRYKNYLKRELLSAKKKLKKSLKRFNLKNLKKLNQRLYNKLQTFQSEQHTFDYLQRQINGIHQIKGKELSNRQLHQIRMLIKSIKEILKMHPDEINPEDFNLSIDGLQKIETDLGDWHDEVVLLASMRRFSKSDKKGKSKNHRSIMESTKQSIAEFKIKIEEDLESLFSESIPVGSKNGQANQVSQIVPITS